MLGSMAEYLFSYRLTARKENKVKLLLKQSRIFRSASGYHRNIFLGEYPNRVSMPLITQTPIVTRLSVCREWV